MFSFPRNISEIGKKVLQNCKKLTTVTFAGEDGQKRPDSMDLGMCIGCDSLISLNVPRMANRQFETFFRDPDTNEVRIPTALKTVKFYTGSNLGEGEFYKTRLEEIDISNLNIKIIPEGAFKENSNLKIMRLPSNITEIHAEAFQNCPKLQEVYINNQLYDNIIPDGVSVLGGRAFYNTGITSITFPHLLTTIP